MTNKVDVAAPEAELITLPENNQVSQDKVDALLDLAKRLPQLEQAMDQFRNFVMRRALPGDWVAFTEMGSTEEVLELGSAATDRIASSLGISFVDFKDYKEAGHDEKGDYFCWWYECTTVWQGRRIERTTGRAGSRDPFFGSVQGELKALSDVKEGDIRTAARRNCMKEGVKLMLGLRRIPKAAAAALGLDVTKVKKVNFGTGKVGDKGAVPAAAGTVVVLVSYTTKQKSYRDKSKGEFTVWIFVDDKGAKYETIKEKFAQEVITHVEKKTPVTLQFTSGQYGNNLEGVKVAPPAGTAKPDTSGASDAGDAQE